MSPGCSNGFWSGGVRGLAHHWRLQYVLWHHHDMMSNIPWQLLLHRCHCTSHQKAGNGFCHFANCLSSRLGASISLSLVPWGWRKVLVPPCPAPAQAQLCSLPRHCRGWCWVSRDFIVIKDNWDGQEEIKGDLTLKGDLTEALHHVKGAGKNDGERTFT